MAWRRKHTTPDVESLVYDVERVQSAQQAAKLILPPDATLNAIVADTSERTSMPIALINFVYADRTDPKAVIGIDMATYSNRLQDSICTYVAAAGKPMVFDNPATAPMLTACIPAQTVTFYAGVPIRYRDRVVGVIAVAHNEDGKRSHRKVLRILRRNAERVEHLLTERT